jgi:hypothetical protein
MVGTGTPTSPTADMEDRSCSWTPVLRVGSISTLEVPRPSLTSIGAVQIASGWMGSMLDEPGTIANEACENGGFDSVDTANGAEDTVLSPIGVELVDGKGTYITELLLSTTSPSAER